MRGITKGVEPQSLLAHRQTPHCNYDNYADKESLRQALANEHPGKTPEGLPPPGGHEPYGELEEKSDDQKPGENGAEGKPGRHRLHDLGPVCTEV